MSTQRLEAFSDGVIAIIITIMVLELKVPHGEQLADLRPLVPVLLSYALSFVYVGIYWTNHHNLFHATPRVTGLILWANLHLLFWQSLIPFVTGWMGENHFEKIPTALYGVVLFATSLAYRMLYWAILADVGRGSALAKSVGWDWKALVSMAVYVTGVALAFVNVWLADAMYVAVALMWLVPDRRTARAAQARQVPSPGTPGED